MALAINCLHNTPPHLSYVFTLPDITQEAQLSQRDRARFHVMEYFAKSLEVTQGHSK